MAKRRLQLEILARAKNCGYVASDKSAKKCAYRLHAKGYLEKTKIGSRTAYKLTSKGSLHLEQLLSAPSYTKRRYPLRAVEYEREWQQYFMGFTIVLLQQSSPISLPRKPRDLADAMEMYFYMHLEELMYE
ncbi:MAG TPA: hypothetical protein VI968_02690 [archaeon]|nr:hypothetical protein [archaeon]